MLREEQASELLLRCEAACHKDLVSIRMNLGKAITRAPAVWELLVIEAASHLGAVDYEPLAKASPDIALQLLGSRTVWIEAAYLYPRFWKEERASDEVARWIFREAKARRIAQQKVRVRLDGDPGPAGPLRRLPELHERRIFLRDPDLVGFFEGIQAEPGEPRSARLKRYTISLSYLPDAKGSHVSIGGLVQEAPRVVSQHAVYRRLKEKAAKRYQIDAPLIVCVGSDQSPALSDMRGSGVVSLRQAVTTAFSKHASLSAVVTVAIENVPEFLTGFRRRARASIFVNPSATHRLVPAEIELLRTLDFNRWKYFFPLQKWEISEEHRPSRVGGSVVWRPWSMPLNVEIPVGVVVDALAGKTTVAAACGFDPSHDVARALQEGWVIVSCSLAGGDLERGESPRLCLDLVPPPMALFWQKGRQYPPPTEAHNERSDGTVADHGKSKAPIERREPPAADPT